MSNAPQGAVTVYFHKDKVKLPSVVSMSSIVNHGKSGFIAPVPKTVVNILWGKGKSKKHHEAIVLEVEHGKLIYIFLLPLI